MTHRVMCLDSELLPLHEWHARGTIDLYALAGVASFGSFQVFGQRTAVHVMSRDGIESSIPANRWQIAKYLESQGKDHRLRVYAPPIVTKYVLAHEIGHYLGLCHFGHDGIQNIMFTTPDADPRADISWLDWGELDFLFDGEPNVSELAQCLEPEAGPIIL